jgi:fructan beta-fructosidase
MNESNIKKSILIASVVLSPVFGQELLANSNNPHRDMQTFESYLDTDYNQKHRPQFHFTSRRNWLNDPNGMVYYDGEYHLFFQHNPIANRGRTKSWGHAVSKDMVHWEQLPHAILPYSGGVIWSGTAAVDHNNTLGQQKGDIKTLLASFTWNKRGVRLYQALAYSTDKGRTFELVNEGKAVVPNQGFDRGERDPKIFWHEESRKWVMILWVKKAVTDRDRRGRGARLLKDIPNSPGKVRFFTSDNLTDWEVASDFDRDWVFECMDFVHLPVDGDPNNKKWLLFDASFDYEIGDFDGRTFSTDKKVGLGDFGPNYYAAQTFNNSPDGRTVVIGWMKDSHFDQVGMPFTQQMSFPTTMELRTTPDGIRLFRWPIKEIESLYTRKHVFKNRPIEELAAALSGIEAELIDASIEFDPKKTGALEWNLRGLKLGYDPTKQQFLYKDTPLAAPAVGGKVKLRVLVDRGSIELFANDGAAVATHYALPDPKNRSIRLSGKGNVSLMINELESSWPEQTAKAQAASHSFVLDKRYLCLPLARDEKGTESTVRAVIDGKYYFVEPMHFTDTGLQWWASLNVSQYQGQTLTLHGVPESAASRIRLSDTPLNHPTLYREANRPQVHFSFRHGALGDPTAKFYYAPKDEWHMFFIYNPFRGREVSWGHAASKDLIHWEEKPSYFEYGTPMFNGTGFVDERNSLGLNMDGQQAIVLLQSHMDRKGGSFSYIISVDGGETFKMVDEIRKELNRPDLPTNPVIESRRHDAPRIYWSEECQRYVLHIKHRRRIVNQYLSKDLKTWEQIEDAPAIPESFTHEGDPGEMVDMHLDGDPEKRYTVAMYGLHGYIVGHYREAGMLNLKGEPISKDDMIFTYHFGYPTIWHNPKNGRIMMGQNLGNNGRGGIPNHEIDYRPDASFPVELRLRSTDQGPRLFFNPIEELKTLYGKRHELGARDVADGVSPIQGLRGRSFRILTTIDPGDAEAFGLDICGARVTYNTSSGMLAVGEDAAPTEPGRKRRPLPLDKGRIHLDILVDTTSLEVFANNGAVHIPHGRQKLYERPEGDIKFFADGGTIKVESLEVIELNSIWK